MLFFMSCTSITNATDLLDMYKRALEHNTDVKYSDIDYKIANEKYNQTISTVFPEISFNAQTKKTSIEKYAGSSSINDYTLDTYSVDLVQPIFHLDVFDELEKAENNIKKNNVKKSNLKKEIMIDAAILYFNLIKKKNLLKSSKIKKKFLKTKLSNAHILFF